MSQMTTGQARVVDPILSTHARGYRPAARTGRLLFPLVEIAQRGAKVLRFGKESFRVYNARRAPGASTQRVQYGYASDPVALVQDSLEGTLPMELQQEAAAVPGIDLAAGSIEMVMDALTLIEEIEQAALAQNPANYDGNHKVALSGADKWSDPDCDLPEQFADYMEAVRKSTGAYPNLLHLSPDAFKAARLNRKVRAHFGQTSPKSVNEAMLADLLGVEQIAVGKSCYLPDNATEEDDFVDCWGNSAVLAYVAKGNNYRVPSYGYTYVLPGMPAVEPPYYDRNTKSWIYPTTHERRPYLVGATAGFLIQNPA